jgi:hypothetical protein
MLVRAGEAARPTLMQPQVSGQQSPGSSVTTFLLSPQVDGPMTDRQMAELHEAWLEHQVNPLREIQSRGVPYSALND